MGGGALTQGWLCRDGRRDPHFRQLLIERRLPVDDSQERLGNSLG